MNNSYKLAGAEQEIMKLLWANGGSLSTSDLLAKVNTEGKTWKRQTLNTILARLEAKGMVSRPRAYVEATVSEKKLMQLQAEEILDSFYDGNLKNFCAALIGDVKANKKEATNLFALIDKIQKKQKG